jgi:methyl-accepting chemotaxis protein
MFNNLKLRTILLGGFIVVALCSVIVGVIGIRNMGTINDMADRMYDRELLAVSYVKEANINLIYIGRDWRTVLLATSAEERAKAAKAFSEHSKAFTDYIDKARPLFISAEGKASLAKVDSSFALYAQSAEKVLALAAKNALATRSEEMSRLQTEMLSYGNGTDDLLTTLTNLKESQAKKASEESTEIYLSSRMVMIALSLGSLLLGLLLGYLLTRRVEKQLGGEPALAVEVATRIAVGDLTSQIQLAANDKSSLLASMQRMQASIQALVADATMLATAAVAGKLATRADAGKHQGDYQAIVKGVNETLDAVIGPLNVTAKYVDDISKGVIPPVITDNYNGDFNIIKTNLNNMVKMMSELLAQTDIIIKGAADGELDKRANADLFVGGWNQLVKGVNEAITNIVNPMNVTADYVDKVAKGIIPPVITTEYKGQYNIIKNNLNNMVKMMSELLAQTDILIKGATAGELDKRANAELFVGGWNQLVTGVNDILNNVVPPIQDVQRVMAALEQGDMTQTITKAYQGDFNSLKEAINNTIAKLVDTITQINTAADALTNAAGQVSATAQSLSQSSSEQAASVEETTSSMEQMTASISQNTENAKVTDGMASKSAKEAAEGGDAVSKTVDDMKSIAGKIGIIDDIAYQTNLLALNAAIEAARAGDHGKGFAVVAAEVRKLAERSQIAAQEIGNLASSSVKQAERAGALLTEMVPSIRKTSDLVQEIASASQEQSSGVAQINGAMGQLNQTTQQNASASEELAATAEELGAQANELQQTMTFFKLEDASRGARRGPVRGAKPAVKLAANSRMAASPAHEGDFERF